ncbi:MAG TPA: Gfo/Idh/MocA family oxidoreductase [Ktedonobacterales bacterium]|nr:Gfo/Idh/MocA family oxidoreductase [Ktedonobacterales bacterium]
MSEALRVGVVGYGLAGSVFHAPLIAATPGLRVAAIVTGDPARQARARADYPGATIHATTAELLAQPGALDLVVVAAPNRAHVTVGLAALEAGLPIVVDKPVAASVAEAERLRDAAHRAGKLFTVFQNRRWDNDFLTLRHLIAAGALGRMVRLESRFERYRPELKPDAWRERADPNEGGGLLFDLGAHLIDQARVLFGQPVSVYAESDARRGGAAVDDDTFVALRFAGGEVAHLWASVMPREPGPRYRAVGMRGIYEKHGLDPQEDALAAGARPGDAGWGREPPERWGRLVTEIGGLTVAGTVETLPGAYEAYYAQVRDALTSHAAPPVDPEDSIAVLRLIESARESARTGAVVRV